MQPSHISQQFIEQLPAQLKSDYSVIDQALERQLSALPNATTDLYVGYSGGVDSSLLLFLLKHKCPNAHITAIHCNHQISPFSDQWQAHCEQFTQNIGVEFKAYQLQLGSDASEEQARLQRRNIFATHLSVNSPLFLGQHLNDQAETQLFRLFRGTGLLGLQAMSDMTKAPITHHISKQQHYYICRPMLEVSKANLIGLAQALNLSWIEDESNQVDQYDRNYIRNNIIPAIQKRWPHVLDKLALLRRHAVEDQQLLSDYALQLQQQCLKQLEPYGFSFSILNMMQLNQRKRRLLLRSVGLMTNSRQLNPIELEEIEKQFLQSKSDSQPLMLLGSIKIKRYNNRLFFLQLPTVIEWLDNGNTVYWDGLTPLQIQGYGTLLERNKQQGKYQIGFSHSGLRAKPNNRDKSQKLKNIFQEQQIPPWLRNRLPIIVESGTVLAVADKITCSAHEFVWFFEPADSLD